MAIKIEIGRFPRALPQVIDAITEFLAELATHIDVDDVWTVDILKQTKSTLRFYVRRFDKDCVHVRVMPGGSDTCWECCLRPKKTDPFVLGRELTLWNGYDGHNIPAAVLANTGEFDEADHVEIKEVSLMDRIAVAEKHAKAYRDRKRAIAAAELQVVKALEEAERLQQQLDKLTAEHAADVNGKTSCEAIDAFSRLLTMPA